MNVSVIEGDLLTQDVEVIVNAWNRNIIRGGFCRPRASPALSNGAVALSLSAKWPDMVLSRWEMPY
jgi:O-acetyl-ADP-ribose deacetylase (regulator of RNase III)